MSQKGKLLCLDEVQRKPDIFPLLRSLADDWKMNGSFIVLGSASGDLLKQSSESLAGRISYKRLTPFLWDEISDFTRIEDYLVKGGFPGSLLTENDSISVEWRDNFIITFIERDLGILSGANSMSVRRLWHMIAHHNGQTINYTSLGNSLGISNTSVKNYIDILTMTYMVDIIPPHVANLGKRLIRAPKIYISDSGLTAAILGIRSFDQLSGHPVMGSLWEGVVLSNLRGHFPHADIRFYRTSHGAELDFIIVSGRSVLAIECKASIAPVLTRGSYTAIDDLKPEYTFIAAPVEKGYPLKRGIDVVSLSELIARLKEYI
jgi:predicted AAA+ superfamily ATPase